MRPGPRVRSPSSKDSGFRDICSNVQALQQLLDGLCAAYVVAQWRHGHDPRRRISSLEDPRLAFMVALLVVLYLAGLVPAIDLGHHLLMTGSPGCIRRRVVDFAYNSGARREQCWSLDPGGPFPGRPDPDRKSANLTTPPGSRAPLFWFFKKDFVACRDLKGLFADFVVERWW